jgi:hypothetical protein
MSERNFGINLADYVFRHLSLDFYSSYHLSVRCTDKTEEELPKINQSKENAIVLSYWTYLSDCQRNPRAENYSV